MKPVILLSKCLDSARCRWDGEIIEDKFIEKLKPRVTFVTVCPELKIGLGVPRDKIRIVSRKGCHRLMQLNTGKDLTEKMNKFTAAYMASIKRADGFILKDRSPSCGIKNVKVYSSLRSRVPVKKFSGFFGKAVLENFPGTPVETDARLKNPAIQRRFIERVFARALKKPA
ncbi:MAG: DUF523 domain-containing protein [Candidatus Omnitrophota bacterium]|jgi:uncharacterized protein YbbK (DUF523 family)